MLDLQFACIEICWIWSNKWMFTYKIVANVDRKRKSVRAGNTKIQLHFCTLHHKQTQMKYLKVSMNLEQRNILSFLYSKYPELFLAYNYYISFGKKDLLWEIESPNFIMKCFFYCSQLLVILMRKIWLDPK